MLTTVVAGHLCIDLIPTLTVAEVPKPGELAPSGPIELAIGGCVGNTGVALFSLGCDVFVDAAVGRDHLGDLARQMLATAIGAERVRLAVLSEATSYSIVIDTPGGDRAFWHHVGANSQYATTHFTEADILHIGYPTALPALSADSGAGIIDVLTRARAEGVTTSIDLSSPSDAVSADRDWASILKEMLPAVDLASPSLADIQRLVPELEAATAATAAQWLVDSGVAVALVTDGSNGAECAYGSQERFERGGRALARQHAPASSVHIAAASIEAGRTTGAGDVASAGLLAAAAYELPTSSWPQLAVAAATAHVAGQALTPLLITR